MVEGDGAVRAEIVEASRAARLRKGLRWAEVGEVVGTNPLIYRFYELVAVYGTTFKELIDEEFGDGIMSAIDFAMSIEREPHPAGDRVRIVLDGKFLPCKRY